jgi:hypothetical protein
VKRESIICGITGGTQAQLEAGVARIHATLMDRRRPLWEAHVIEGLQSGQVGLYIRVHHAVLDGAAGMALAGALLDPAPEPREVPRPPRGRRAQAAPPGIVELARARCGATSTSTRSCWHADLIGVLAA